MNLQEFAKLRAGDKIENPMNNSRGTVTETTDNGVLVAWGDASTRPFAYSAQSTAWFHWVREDNETQPEETT